VKTGWTETPSRKFSTRAPHEQHADKETVLKTLVIGRSPFADVVIADTSVAPHHAEIVVTDDDRLYLTDCGTNTGTWRKRGSQEGANAGSWSPVRQDFIDADEPLRLGDHQCTAAELMHTVRAGAPSDAQGTQPAWDRSEGHRQRLRGRLERDPATGEIVPRRP
jgi:arylamine N-acetyltransferase